MVPCGFSFFTRPPATRGNHQRLPPKPAPQRKTSVCSCAHPGACAGLSGQGKHGQLFLMLDKRSCNMDVLPRAALYRNEHPMDCQNRSREGDRAPHRLCSVGGLLPSLCSPALLVFSPIYKILRKKKSPMPPSPQSCEDKQGFSCRCPVDGLLCLDLGSLSTQGVVRACFLDQLPVVGLDAGAHAYKGPCMHTASPPVSEDQAFATRCLHTC